MHYYALLCVLVRLRTKKVGFESEITYFKPRAVPLRELREVELTIDKLETLRFSNMRKLSQIKVAEKMGVHQLTF